jgi:hypothetical protein
LRFMIYDLRLHSCRRTGVQIIDHQS